MYHIGKHSKRDRKIMYLPIHANLKEYFKE